MSSGFLSQSSVRDLEPVRGLTTGPGTHKCRYPWSHSIRNLDLHVSCTFRMSISDPLRYSRGYKGAFVTNFGMSRITIFKVCSNPDFVDHVDLRHVFTGSTLVPAQDGTCSPDSATYKVGSAEKLLCQVSSLFSDPHSPHAFEGATVISQRTYILPSLTVNTFMIARRL